MHKLNTPPKSVLHCWSFKANARALIQREHNAFHILDGLRFWGFIWILIIHTVMPYVGFNRDNHLLVKLLDDAPFYLWWIWNADKAVDLFFVLSGFLIGQILLRELHTQGDINLKRFYSRRYLRLTPVYAVILLVFWLGEGPNHATVWANLLYINNFLPVKDMAIYRTWTLAVEEQFYLILPILLLLTHRFLKNANLKVLLILLILSLVIRALAFFYFDELWNGSYQAMIIKRELSWIYHAHIYDNLITRFGPFVLGVIIAHSYCFHSQDIIQWLQRGKHRALLINMGTMALLVFFMYFPMLATANSEPGWSQRLYLISHRTLFSAAFAWFLLATFLKVNNFQWLVNFYSWKVWHPLSELTYSMYIIHAFFTGPIVYYFVRSSVRAGEQPTLLSFLTTVTVSASLALIISIFVSTLLWLLVEKPFLNLREYMAFSRRKWPAGRSNH